MSVGSLPPPTTERTDVLTLYRFRVEEYQRMGEIGVLTPEHRVELLEGLVVQKLNLNPPHMLSLGLINRELTQLISSGWHTRIQGPITTSDSEPEPDLVVARGDLRDYGNRHPSPGETGLVIEVADSSLSRDRGPKARLYARAGIATYWIVNLIDRQIEVRSDPTGAADEPQYATTTICKPGGELPLVLDGTEVGRLKVNDLLP